MPPSPPPTSRCRVQGKRRQSPLDGGVSNDADAADRRRPVIVTAAGRAKRVQDTVFFRHESEFGRGREGHDRPRHPPDGAKVIVVAVHASFAFSVIPHRDDAPPVVVVPPPQQP